MLFIEVFLQIKSELLLGIDKIVIGATVFIIEKVIISFLVLMMLSTERGSFHLNFYLSF